MLSKSRELQILLTDKYSLSASLFKHACSVHTRRISAIARDEACQQRGLYRQIMSTQMSRSDFYFFFPLISMETFHSAGSLDYSGYLLLLLAMDELWSIVKASLVS